MKLIEHEEHFYLQDHTLPLKKEDLTTHRFTKASTNKDDEFLMLDKSAILILLGRDDVESLKKEYFKDLNNHNWDPEYAVKMSEGFEDSYNKAKEVYKYTEEDLLNYIKNRNSIFREVIKEVIILPIKEQKSLPQQWINDEVHKRAVASLSPKEWEVEIEEERYSEDCIFGNKCSDDKIQPKITNGYIIITKII